MTKQKALGSILEWDQPADDCTTFVAIGCTPSVKPPEQEDEEIEAICLDDTLDVPVSGIDSRAEAAFDIFFDAGVAIHKALFDARLARTVACWRLLTPHKGFDALTVVDTYEWKGRVRAFRIQELLPNNVYRARLEIRLTEQMTLGTHTIP